MTVHMLTEEVDGGRIIAQRQLPVEDHIDDGLLRQQLSALQYPILMDLLYYLEGTRDAHTSIEDVGDRYHPFELLKVSYSQDSSILTLSRQVRASSPFPGLMLSVGGEMYKVTKQLSYVPGVFDASIDNEDRIITICGDDGMLKMIGEKI